MLNEKAEVIVANNLKRIESLNSSFSLLTEQMIIDFEESKTGCTDLTQSHMSLGTQHQHITKVTTIPEEVLLSYVFYHEMGHQLLPWSNLPNQQLHSIMADYFSQEKDYRGSPEYFLETQNFSIFHDSKIKDFYQQLLTGLDNISNETNTLLSNFSHKLEAIYHEQFAECFSLFMMKNQFPKEFDQLTSLVFEKRKNGEMFYRDSHDDLMDSSFSSGFVHCLHNVSQEYVKHLNSTSSNNKTFEDFQKSVFSFIDKHTILEMKTSMDNQKLAVYFPNNLKHYLSEDSVKDRIQSIRKEAAIKLNSSSKKPV